MSEQCCSDTLSLHPSDETQENSRHRIATFETRVSTRKHEYTMRGQLKLKNTRSRPYYHLTMRQH